MALPLATLLRQLRGRRGAGYLHSPTDERDELHAWAPVLGAGKILPSQRALSRHVALRDQGGTNSCCAHAVDHAMQVLCGEGRGPRGRPYTLRSVAAPYWHGRVLNGLEGRDGGAVLRSVLKANAELGAPPDHAWPLRARAINQQPGADTYRLGRSFRGLRYSRIRGDVVQGALEALSADLPVVVGLGIDAAFMSAGGPAEVLSFGPVATGHAAAIVGFTRTVGRADSVRFRTANSWGDDWRDGGYCDLGPDVVAGAFEAWVLTGWFR